MLHMIIVHCVIDCQVVNRVIDVHFFQIKHLLLHSKSHVLQF